MFYNSTPTHCGQTTEQELNIAATELAAMQGLYDAIGSVIKVYGNHIVQESKLVDVHSWLVINLPEKREQVEKLAAKLDEEIANSPAPEKEDSIWVKTEEWEKLQAAANPEPKACDWSYDGRVYSTKCGHNINYNGNRPLYCKFCGGSIRS